MTSRAPETSDEFLWLEEIDSPEAAEWVRAANARTLDTLTAGERFAALRAEIRQVLDAADRVPYPTMRGGRLYNLWQDAAHPRGLWRRTTLDQYRRADPDWETLLDVDALAEAEGENWVWEGVESLHPDVDRCLVSLSRGGADATVVREYDLRRRAFVPEGFHLPEAKSSICWIDPDHIFVSTDLGPGSLTSSGYPRVVRRWRRGTPLAEAETVFEGRESDVSVYAIHDPTPGHERDFVLRGLDFYRTESYLRTASGELRRIEVPEDAGWSAHREWLLVRLRSPWSVAGRTYPAGALLVTRFDDFLAGRRDLTVLFEPDERSSLSSYHWTRRYLVIAVLTDVRTRLEVLAPHADGWRREPLPEAGDFDHVAVVDTDPLTDDGFLLSTQGFLRPDELLFGTLGAAGPDRGDARADSVAGPDRPVARIATVKRAPAFFDPADLTVRQFFATSTDGTRVPYFVVGPERPGGGPTLLAGYGGFEVSLTPGYNPVVGRAWLARGGTFVVANIRGGGEYGPRWHRAALRERRPRAYEDFAAVAADLVSRGITEPQRLGVTGGSNGGLLTGVMLTRYPELFGAVVANVPLLDMRRYHLLLAGASWMAEYGDPDVEADWAYLRGFSPYHNVRADGAYPPLLLLTSTRDDRVHPGHARKMAALLGRFGHDVSYHENVEGGHGGAADNAQRALVRALEFEFLWRRLTDGEP